MSNAVIAGALVVLALTLIVGLLSDEWRGRILGRRLADTPGGAWPRRSSAY